MQIRVSKVTDKQLMKDACAATIHGAANPSLKNMYASEHSPIRTQMFWIECKNIPLYVSTHLLRHHVGSQPYALTHRTDRKGGGDGMEDRLNTIKQYCEALAAGDDHVMHPADMLNQINIEMEDILNRTGRNTPTNLSMFINAQGLIDMAHLRLCSKASTMTQRVFNEICDGIANVDPDLRPFLVPNCIYRNGLCGEFGECSFMEGKYFERSLLQYRTLFKRNKNI